MNIVIQTALLKLISTLTELAEKTIRLIDRRLPPPDG